MNILITDGENRSSLAATRSLGRKGYNIFVVGKEIGNLSASSKFCKISLFAPDPMEDSENYLRAIKKIVRDQHIDVILPMTEQAVYCLNKSRDQFGESVILACASPEKMDAVSNKYDLFQLAGKLRISIPQTVYVSDTKDFLRKRDRISDFPVVVKPAFSKYQDGRKIISTGVMYATNYMELDHLYETKPELCRPSMIQEMIKGEGTGLFTLFDRSRHLALFSHRRILEKPPSGGVSVLAESIPLDEEMVEAARKLLSEVKWTGIAMVEFKRDIRDGKAKLMEINGRFWGSLQLAVSSGVDFPAHYLDYYLGKKSVSVLTDYKIGYKLKWFFGMLDHLVVRWKKRKKFQNLPPNTLPTWRVAAELVNLKSHNTSFDVFDTKDFMPSVTESKAYIMNLLRVKR